MDVDTDPERADALEQYKKKLLELREMEAKLKKLRMDIKGLQNDYETTEDNIKALQSVGQIIGEVLKQLDDERCRLLQLAHETFFANILFKSLSKPPQDRDTWSVADRRSTKLS